ncbi:Alpha/Beta hydrolase fold, partial [Hyaloscypha variabilis]
LIPLLPSSIPIFIPDVPGYGRSAPLPGPHDKRSTGNSLLATLSSLLPSSSSPIPLILLGHDRGARISYRLAVDFSSSTLPTHLNFSIHGTILLDIVPTLVQWQSCISPLVNTGSFHWSFLANVELATTMILAQGGDNWVRMCLARWIGSSSAGREKFEEDGAVEVYAASFKQERVVRASCDDYRAGAMEDVKEQVEDQREGRKVEGDVLVVYSKKYLGGRYDVRKIWEEWMGNGNLETLGLEGDVGHFLAEESPEETASAVREFYEKHA